MIRLIVLLMVMGVGLAWFLAGVAGVVWGRRLAGPFALGKLGFPVPFAIASVALSPLGVGLAAWLLWKRELVPAGVLSAWLTCLRALFTTASWVLAASAR
jgi:threonine/homoserine efflux transporter RhtA